MRIEAFSEAKRPDAPDTNEDALLILPDRAFAVLDGVTDRVGSRYDGILAGRYASRLLQQALERMLSRSDAPLSDPWAVVQAMEAEIRTAYNRFGVTEQVRADWNRQMASTMALVMLSGDFAHVVLVGDSGLRINGQTLIREEKDLDFITSCLRQNAWGPISARVQDPNECERLSRLVTFSGTQHAADAISPLLNQDDLDSIETATLSICRLALPRIPEVDLLRMVQGGIVNGQGGYQNNNTSALGYPSLNGFDIKREMIRIERLSRANLHSIELYSDGYFAPGDAFGVDSWEKKFREIEERDPHKVIDYPSPKGSANGLWADDRTYLGVVF